MRVNVYTEELCGDWGIATVEYVSSKTGNPMINYGLRIFLKSHPDLHRSAKDDDRSAVTIWCGSDRGAIAHMLKNIIAGVEAHTLPDGEVSK